jgi:hypothetical protein
VSNFDKIIGLLGSATFIGALLYWTGRWYKQSYFDVFKIPYEAIGFDHYYYIYHSWCTVLVAIALVGIFSFFLFTSINLIQQIQFIRHLYNITMSSLIFFILSSILTFVTFFFILRNLNYQSNYQILNKLLVSKDIMIILIGIISIILLTFFSWTSDFDLSKKISIFINKFLLFNFPAILSICLLIWLHFATIGYILGHYHANSAISKRKKMQLPNIKLKDSKPGERWLYIAKASNTHNYIFEVNSKKTACVTDEEIIEMK